MADGYDAGSQVSGYGSPGATAFFGVQQELLRRAQLAEAARQRQLAEQRQQEQDALNNDRTRQEIAASKSNVATNEDLRASNAEKNRAAAAKTAQDEFAKTVAPGTVTPEARDKGTAAGLGHLFLIKPRAAVPGTEPLKPGDVGPEQPAQPAGEDITYTGTVDQQEREAHKAFAQEVLDGTHDTGNDALDQWNKARAQELLMTGKETGSGPAAGLITPKTATETDQRRYLDIATRQKVADPTKPVSETEQAWAKSFESLHPTEAQKQGDAVNRIHITLDGAKDRASTAEVGRVKQQFRKDLGAEDTKLSADLERVDRAQKVLNSPNFLSDAIAAPEVLQIMAGGMGSGLRMTDAELNRVNGAQSKLDQLRGELAKYGIGAPKTLQDDIRKNMKALVDTVKQARERKAKLLEDAFGKLDEASTPAEVDALRAQYMTDRRSAGNINGAQGDGGGLPAGVTVTKRKK